MNGAARLALLALVGAATACASSGSKFDPDDPRLMGARLELVSAASVTLRYAEAADLEVRYVYDDGSVVAGAPLAFELIGTSAGAALGARSADTNGEGIASNRLTAGRSAAIFAVRITPPVGDAIDVSVAVADADAGGLAVSMTYPGTTPFDRFTAYVYEGRACAAITTTSVSGFVRMGTPVTRLTDRPGFAGLPLRTDYTVAVVAEAFGVPMGFGCRAGVAVTQGMETLVPVNLSDVAPPVQFEGVYDLGNQMDFAGALPPSVATSLRVLAELTDDADIEGNATTDDWGQDPGAFVVDYVARQTCRWECGAGESFSSCTEMNHPLGDLRALYQHSLGTWDRAESAFTGGCFVWEVAGQYAQELVNSAVGTYVPEIVVRFIETAGDLATAITNARIQSVLTLGAATQMNVPMTHVLERMEVRIRDLGGVEQFVNIRLADVGLRSVRADMVASRDGDRLIIPAHSFDLDLGKLVQFIYVNAVLPLFGFSSTADMLREWIDCAAIAVSLHDFEDTLSVAQYQSACETGLEAAGDIVDENLGGLIGASTTLTLEGEARGGDLTVTGLAQTLNMGVWTGSWGDSGMSGAVTGTFNGVRRP